VSSVSQPGLENFFRDEPEDDGVIDVVEELGDDSTD
jgi:hypothetical protein